MGNYKWIDEELHRYTFGNKTWKTFITDNEDYPFNVQYWFENSYCGIGRFCKTGKEAMEYILKGLEEHFNFDANQIDQIRDAFYDRESEEVINFLGQINPTTNKPYYSWQQMYELRLSFDDIEVTTDKVHFIAQINPETNAPVYDADQMRELRWASRSYSLTTEQVQFIAQLNPETHTPIFSAGQMDELRDAFCYPKPTTDEARFIGTIDPLTHKPVFSAKQMQELRCAFGNGESIEDIKRKCSDLALAENIEHAEKIVAEQKPQVESPHKAPRLGDVQRQVTVASRELNSGRSAQNLAQER